MTSALLLTRAPRTAAQFDEARNTVALSTLAVASNRRVAWACDKGPDHQWSQRVDARTSWGDLARCPYCTNRKLSVTNSLVTVAPELAGEFDEATNGVCARDVIAAASTRRYYWRCGRGHTYRARLSHRLEGHGCPNSSCSVVTTSKPHQQLADALGDVLDGTLVLNEFVEGVMVKGELKRWEADILLVEK